MPDKSPFTSAKNVGTPIALKLSASTCNVTVLPVPVAPAINPWRLAICGSRTMSALFLATRIEDGGFICLQTCLWFAWKSIQTSLSMRLARLLIRVHTQRTLGYFFCSNDLIFG